MYKAMQPELYTASLQHNPYCLGLNGRLGHAFRKHTYSNILKIALPKTKKFSDEILMFFIFLLKNIDCGYP